jgi:hypothetical protein
LECGVKLQALANEIPLHPLFMKTYIPNFDSWITEIEASRQSKPIWRPYGLDYGWAVMGEDLNLQYQASFIKKKK